MTGAVPEVFGKGGKAVAEDLVKQQSRATLNALLPTASPKVVEATVTLVGVGFDVIYDGVVERGPTKGTLIQVGTKGVAAAVSGLTDDEKLECFSALLMLGGEAYELSQWSAATAALELGSGGLATPAAMVTLAMAVRSAANTASAIIKVNQQCGPVVTKGYTKLKADWGRLAGELEATSPAR